MMKHSLHHASGFTLIETLVAVAVLAIAITGPLVIATKSLNAAIFARDQVIAFYLAQEGMEFVRNKRDEYGLRQDPNFESDFSACFTANGCTVDSWNGAVSACSGTCPPIKYITGEIGTFYSYSVGQNTKFTRTVVMAPEPTNGDETIVTVTVEWATTDVLQRSFSIQTRLLDWQQF